MKSRIFCSALWNSNSLCRTLDCNSDKQCRLFEGYISTGTVHSFPGSVVDAVVYYPTTGPSLFSNYSQTCADKFDVNHYLVCSDLTNRCQYPSDTFWNGTFFVNQLYPSSTCTQSNWCRQDLNLTCNSTTNTCQEQLYHKINHTAGYNWTYHLHTYTTFNTIATVMFGFRSDTLYYWLDDVSVYDTQNTTVKLIQN